MGESDHERIPELFMNNIAMEAMALIEIDDLPIEHGHFPWLC